MDLQRADVPYLGFAHSVATVAFASLMAAACVRTDTSATPPASSEGSTAPVQQNAAPPVPSTPDGVPGGLTDRFAEDTPRQTELRDTAIGALQYNDLDTAITALLALRDEGPMSEARASGMLLLSELYFQQDRVNEALQVLEALRPASPPQSKLEYLLGRTYRHLDRTVEAEDAWRRAIRLEPDFLRSHYALSAMLRSLGRDADAQEVELALERQLQLLAGRVLDGSEDERLAAIEALGQAQPDERVVRALVPVLGDPSVLLAVSAAMSLAQAGTASALEPLRTARTAASDPRVSQLFDQALAELEARLSAQ